jgi:hypothetical protein
MQFRSEYISGSDGSMVKKLEAQKGYEQPSSTRRPFSKLHLPKINPETILGLGLAAVLGGPMVFPKMVRAQDATSTASIQQKQMKVTYVSIKNITAYIREAEKHKIAAAGSALYHVELSDSTAISVILKKKPHEDAPPGESGNLIFIGIYPKGGASIGYDISLSELKAAYLAFSGQELRYVRIGTVIQKDNSGEYAEFYVIPVSSKDGTASSGTPIGVIQGWNGGFGTMGCGDTNKVLISMK